MQELPNASCKAPHFVKDTNQPVPLESHDESEYLDLDEESLRRLQACVTACEGISTEDLEDGLVARMRAALVKVVPLLEEAERMKAEQAAARVQK